MNKIIFSFAFLASMVFVTAAAGCNDSAGKDETKLESSLSHDAASPDKAILQVWELPAELLEISANVLVDEKRMACIQDNKGIIYIYNLDSKSVENKIEFAGKGDYEGLAYVNKTFYVLRSDGFIFEVETGSGSSPSVKTYDLPFDATNDTESLFYDKTKNRLLVAVKEKDLTAADSKGVYSFDLATKKMNTNAIMQIGNSNSDSKKKKKTDRIKPSDLAINPSTGEVYILNGPQSELLIATSKGEITKTIQLNKSVFPQPEGLCFTPSGGLYISSEGAKRGKGVIARVDY
jgi:co-chaperonin GroES (HSP10)